MSATAWILQLARRAAPGVKAARTSVVKQQNSTKGPPSKEGPS